ncbi:FGGY-family carbohydrate kinase [Pseudoroseomonas ludipueritiae]|uniref:FGGY-family carbohydrate kinase n=1 Tax=Pseudoroseomonas ludipueritiae TaxID=198093 RepID=A0ABR7R271_9PROT|nr:FGGY-family carbohydrate kinase [Pseudoroseomonas ludipueritiae]MBC9175821.1 FGGY-family carbohydrate kinase [Pseudoroseomonas ludipueritiae]
MQDIVIGVDVGTGSARAGAFTPDGTMLAQAAQPIRMWRPRPGFAQQSSTDIWAAVCAAVRNALAELGPVRVRGIGFDATCSLVALDATGGPVSISPDAEPEQDTVVWMDHRAAAEAERINAGGHDVLRYVGGRVSLEMQTPKLLWLKHHLPEAWARAALFLDLPDFLTWRATGSTTRSLCSTVCKWTYLGREGRWDEGFFRAIGLEDLAAEGFQRIGTEILPVGHPIPGGLSATAATELGLPAGIPVGTSAIDAHAGGLGVIGAAMDGQAPDEQALLRRLALVGGTSSCHMAVSAEPRFVPGVWGPYFSAMQPGLWLNEGGQSATGALVDHVITTHAAYPALAEEAAQAGITIYQRLNQLLEEMAAPLPFPALLTEHLHVMPDFHGNRSPRADASLRGMVSGLRLSATAEDLALLYLATVQAIAYGTRHIIETLNGQGYAIDTVLACGGGTKNPVFLREHADATGCRIVLPAEPEAILLGASMLGAVAGGVHPDLPAAMAAMSRAGRMVEPASEAARRYHDAKYAVFLRMHEDQMAYRRLVAG